MRRARLSAVVCLAVLVVVVSVLDGNRRTGGIVAKVYAENGCTLRTLNGSYGAAGDGLITFGQPPVTSSNTIPIAVAGVQTFDGTGNFSLSNTTNLGGLVFPSTGAGTYTVNADCTGSVTINVSNGEVLHSNIVIVDHGRQILNVSTDPNIVAFGRAIKMDKAED